MYVHNTCASDGHCMFHCGGSQLTLVPEQDDINNEQRLLVGLRPGGHR
jgi:hypothetical protein